jgi:hypothetical protein
MNKLRLKGSKDSLKIPRLNLTLIPCLLSPKNTAASCSRAYFSYQICQMGRKILKCLLFEPLFIFLKIEACAKGSCRIILPLSSFGDMSMGYLLITSALLFHEAI